jgi:hypothetical protein
MLKTAPQSLFCQARLLCGFAGAALTLPGATVEWAVVLAVRGWRLAVSLYLRREPAP